MNMVQYAVLHSFFVTGRLVYGPGGSIYILYINIYYKQIFSCIYLHINCYYLFFTEGATEIKTIYILSGNFQ